MVHDIITAHNGFPGGTTSFLRADATFAVPPDVDTGITQLTGDVTAGPGNGSQAATIPNNTVTNAKLADMALNTIKGNNAALGDPLDLTTAQVTAMLNVFTSLLQGLVPASGGGTANFLRADGSFAAPSGGVPAAHATSHQNGGTDEVNVAGLSGLLADEQTPLIHDILTKHNGFPGGTTTFLRADGTFAAPTASVGAKQTEVDFGDVMQVNSQTFTIVDGDVGATSRITCWLSGDAPTGKDAEDVLAEDPLKFVVVPGVGTFDLYVEQPEGALNGAYKVNYIIAAAI